MKNTNICPKCKGKEIKRFNGTIGAYGTGNNIFIGVTSFSAVKVNRYVCLTCGYVEEWIDEKDIERIKNKQK